MGMETPIPVPAAPREKQLSTVTKGKRLNPKVVAGEFGFAHLLKDMKAASGLTTRQIAKLMGIEKESLDQYFWSKRGRGGSSRLNWFMRFAVATGCTIWLSFPSQHGQVQLRLQVEKQNDPE